MKKFDLLKKIIFFRLIVCLLFANSHASGARTSENIISENFMSVGKEMLVHLKSAAAKDPLKSEIEAVTNILAETLENQIILIHPGLYDNHQTNTVAGEGYIILDRDSWLRAFNKGYDIRSAIIGILLDINDIQSIDMATTLYSLLPKMIAKQYQLIYKAGTRPFCLDMKYRYKLKGYKGSGKGSWKRSPEEAISSAIEECTEKEIFNCKITSVDKIGIGRWTSFKATYEGITFSFIRNSMKRSECFNAKECEFFYTYAPLGQLGIEDFYDIDQLIKQCK